MTETTSSDLAPGRLDGVQEAFSAAADTAGGLVERRFTVAGMPVALRFAGDALTGHLTPALAHLETRTEDEPELTVDLWDSVSTSSAPPPLPPVHEEGPERAFYYYTSPPYQAVYQPGPRTLSVLDLDRNHAWYWVEQAGNLSHWEAAKPIRHVLEWWLAASGLQQVHGGAVGTPEGGVLLVGRGGSGKSTAALSSLRSELLYAGDDYVAVGLDPSPWIHSLYSSGNVHPDNLHRLPHLADALSNADRLDREKAVVYAHEHFPERTTAGFPLRAAFIPRIAADRAETKILEASRAEALRALAPSTIFQSHPSGKTAFAAMARVLERVPAFVLEVGSDTAQIPPTIRDFLSR